MDNHRWRDAASALASGAVLIAVVGGLPVLLVRLVGWPLPRVIPSIAELRHGLSEPIGDAVLIDVLAVVVWIGWAQVVACTTIEIAAWLRGHASPDVPLAGAIQPIVRQLVVTAALLLSPLRPSPHPIIAGGAVLAVVANHPPAKPAPTTIAAWSQAPVAKSAKSYVVQPRDDLWLLAERHLGNPLRYKELVALNVGIVQPDGRTLSNPDLIYPGWILRFPDDAVDLSDPPPGAAPSRTASSQPQPSVLPPTTNPPTSCEPAAGTLPTPSGAITTLPDAPTVPTTVDEPSSVSAPPRHNGQRTTLPVGILGAGLTAAGAVVALDRFRRVQQRHRRPGRMIPLPGAELAGAETALRHAADSSPASRLEITLRALSELFAGRRSGPTPVVQAVAVTDDRVEVLLSEPVDAPEGPFHVTAEGRSWALPSDVNASELGELGDDQSPLAPALVTIGTTEAGTVLIDLEAAALTALDGKPEAADAAGRAIVLELGTSVWADDLYVTVVGPPLPGVDHLERIERASSLRDVLDRLASSTAATARALSDSRFPSTLAARASRTPDDGWTPTIVVYWASDHDSDAFDDLVALADQGRGLAVLIVGDVPDADRHITFADAGAVIDPPGLAVAIPSLTAEEIGQIDDLLSTASDVDAEGGPIFEDDDDEATLASTSTTASQLQASAASAQDDPPAAIQVNVLGPVEVVGAAKPIDRRKSVELVVYLALHPGGVDDDRIKCALWPDALPSPSVFTTTVSLARSCLGTDPDGNPHLPYVSSGQYRTGPYVITDVAALEKAIRTAGSQHPDDAIDGLREALALVRGLPFSGTSGGYEWAHTETLIARLEALVSDAAHLLAQLALEAGDPQVAHWATLQGLQASPADEVLYRDRMLAADGAGNLSGVEAAMKELCRVTDAIEPYDTLHPETVQLYERLKQTHRRSA